MKYFLGGVVFFVINIVSAQLITIKCKVIPNDQSNGLASKSENLCCNSTFTWTEEYHNSFSSGKSSKRFSFDTISTPLNNNSYFEILSSNTFAGENWEHTGDFIRKDDGRVYLYEIQGDRLLYDFDANIGDIFATPNAEIKVSQIDTIVLVNGESRRRLQMECTQTKDNPFYWIEGVGSTHDFLQFFPCQFDWYATLLCVYQNDELIYKNPEADSCWVMITDVEPLAISSTSIFPNPFDDKITIETEERIVTSISITDMLGRSISIDDINGTIVLFGYHQEINVSQLPPGYFVLKFKLKNGDTIIRPMVKL